MNFIVISIIKHPKKIFIVQRILTIFITADLPFRKATLQWWWSFSFLFFFFPFFLYEESWWESHCVKCLAPLKHVACIFFSISVQIVNEYLKQQQTVFWWHRDIFHSGGAELKSYVLVSQLPSNIFSKYVENKETSHVSGFTFVVIGIVHLAGGKISEGISLFLHFSDPTVCN